MQFLSSPDQFEYEKKESGHARAVARALNGALEASSGADAGRLWQQAREAKLEGDNMLIEIADIGAKCRSHNDFVSAPGAVAATVPSAACHRAIPRASPPHDRKVRGPGKGSQVLLFDGPLVETSEGFLDDGTEDRTKPPWSISSTRSGPGKSITPKERPRGENVVNLMDALRKSVGAAAETKATKKPAKKAKKTAASQKEMLMPIAGKKPAKEPASKKPASGARRKSA